MISTGNKAPDFQLEASGGERVSSKDLSGSYAVIVFYPKNSTPG